MVRHRAAPSFSKPSVDGILGAAERAFARRGYGETSLRQLVAEAGVSTTAFYARFESKEAVLQALVTALMTDLTTTAAAALAEARNIQEGFEVGVDALVGVLSAHRTTVRLALTEAASSAPIGAELRKAYGMLAQLMGGKLKRLVDRGEIEVPDADALAWALVGALHMQVLRWAVFDDLDDEALARALRATARTMLPAISRRSALGRTETMGGERSRPVAPKTH